MDSLISWALFAGAIFLVEFVGYKINRTIKMALRIAYFAFGVGQFLGGSAGDFGQLAGLIANNTAQVSATTKPAPIDPAADGAPALPITVLQANDMGHFLATATINYHNVNVMVDTGASFVALTYEDAERLGLVPDAAAFRLRMSTANGIAFAAPIVLDSIELGQVTVHNVKGIVAQKRALQTSLLGMSFLQRLSNFKMGQGRLELSQ